MAQQRFDVSAGVKNLGWIDSVRFKNTFSDYNHKEVESAVVGTTFKNKGDEARLELSHQKTANFTGAFGLQSNVFKLEALGDEAFLPPTDNQIYSVFAFEQGDFGAFKPSFGLRGDATQVKSDETVKFGAAKSKSFAGSSASLGFLYELRPTLSVVVNTSMTERAPNYQELFADGEHVATGSYERGAIDLGKEKAKSVELSLRHKGEQAQASFGVFWQDFEDFIALIPTGQTDPGSSLPIYQFTAVPALMYGAEFDFRHRFASFGAGGNLDFEFKTDFVRGTNRNSGDNLPRIPAIRETMSLVYRTNSFQTELELQRTEKQTFVARNETETGAYTLANISLEAPIRWEGKTVSVFGHFRNIFNVEARNHVSVLKDIAPLPGRHFVAGLQTSF
jgi:iron complex outermembrane receptor protein